MQIIKKRKDFLKAAKGKRWITPAFILLAIKNEFDENISCPIEKHTKFNDKSSNIRFGFTVSKKVGNAVLRNRAKRRLKEAARNTNEFMNSKTTENENIDFVVIARKNALDQNFAKLLEDMNFATYKLSKMLNRADK